MKYSLLDEVLKPKELNNRYIDNYKIPLGTKHPPYSYWNREKEEFNIPDEDIVYISIRPNEQFFCLNLGYPGCGKTIVSKRILYYLNKMKYNCAVFDYKGYEWYYSRLLGCDINLLPGERPDTMKIESLIPAFRKKLVGRNAKKIFKTFSFHLSDINTQQELISLGFTSTGAIDLLNALEKRPTDKISTLIEYFKGRKMHGATKEALIKRLSYFEDKKFFDEESDSVNLKEYWNNGLTPNFAMFATPREELSFIFGKLINNEFFRFKNYKKFVMIDDGHNFIPAEKKGDNSSSMGAEAIQEKIYQLGRLKRWNMMLATQQPAYVREDIIEGATHIICSRMGNVGNAVANKINDPLIIKKIKNLVYDKASFLREKLLLLDDGMTYRTFYEFGPIVGHTIGTEYKRYDIL